MPLELGAEFVHGRPAITWKLLHEAGLAAVDLPFDHRIRRGGRLVQLPNTDAELGKVFSGLPHLGSHDISFAQYLRNRPSGKGRGDARRFAVNFVEGFDAADPERISAKSLAEEQEGIGDTEGQTQFRPLSGYGALIKYLHGSLDSKRVRIALETSVSEIAWQKSGVQIRTDRQPAVLRAPRVIVTLPLGILQIPPEAKGSIHITPDLPQKRAAAMKLASGPIVKAILQFEKPFWEDDAVARAARADRGLRDAIFMHVTEARFPTWWTLRPLRLPVLIGWAGGPKAVALAGLSKSELLQAAIDSLATLLGQRPRRLISLLRKFDCKDWASDPFSRGAYSYVTVGGMRARAALAKPIAGTLFFAGEATDTSGQASTVAGALISGQRAAKEVLASL